MRPLILLLAMVPTLLFATLQEEMIDDLRLIFRYKPGVQRMLDELAECGVVERRGSDAACRTLFVSLQAGFEEAMTQGYRSGRLSNLRGAIHTPMPATPCCTEGAISDGLVHPSLLEDPDRLQTVEVRAVLIRNYLASGARLLIAYPSSGLAKRTAQQQAIYTDLVEEYANLSDSPLDLDALDPNLVGATYLFSADGVDYLFAIRASQANAPSDQTGWKIWFAPLSSPAAAVRFIQVSNLID